MPLSTRYGLAGLCGLALLSLAHWIREHQLHLGELGDKLVGVAPNFAAAIAITFVIVGVYADQRPLAGATAVRRWFGYGAAVAVVGLVGWEFIQKTSPRFVFDVADIVATLVGILVGFGMLVVLTPKR